MIRLYGKTLPEIFREIPLPYQIVVVAGTLFIVFTIFYVGYLLIFGITIKDPDKLPAMLSISRQAAESMLDPSIAVDMTAKRSFLAYTVVDPMNLGVEEKGVSVSLASSVAPCKRWSWTATLFSSKAEALVAPDAQSELATGTVRYETPSIVHDPQDKGREWKAFAYRYFWAEDNVSLAQRYSVIAYRHASDPIKEWSPEEWILSAAPDYPPPPYQGVVRAHINSLHPALARFTSYSRPSVIEAQGVLLMTLSAFQDRPQPDSIVLLISTNHGRSWAYAGIPLSARDLGGIGPYTQLGGASLVQEKGVIYLAAVLGDDKTAALGTFIFPFGRLAQGVLQKDAAGKPLLVKHIPLQSAVPSTVGGGFGTYSDNCPQGMITSEYSVLQKGYRLFRTMQKPASEK